MCGCEDLFLGLLAILFPPVAVWIKRGVCTADSFINIALCVLGYLPGLIHAWYIISSYPRTYEYQLASSYEDGTSRFVHSHSNPHTPTHGHYHQPHSFPASYPSPNRSTHPHAAGYGTLGPDSVAAKTTNAHNDGSMENPPTYADVLRSDNHHQGSS